MPLLRIYAYWLHLHAQLFRIAIEITVKRFGLSEKYDGVKELLENAHHYETMHPTTKRLMRRLLDPHRWIDPSYNILTITDMFNKWHMLTEIDLLRYHLGDVFETVNRVMLDETGTHLFVYEREVAQALSPRIVDTEEQRYNQRLQLAATLLSRLTGMSIDPASLEGSSRIVYEKSAMNMWRRC